MTKKKECKPGRWKRVCSACKGDFSTHSSDREVCHKCRPKCRETHEFKKRPAAAGPAGKMVKVRA